MTASELSDVRQRAEAERLNRIKALHDLQVAALANQVARCEAAGLTMEVGESGYSFTINAPE